MAKQTDRLAGAAKTEKAGSPISGLFAEENEFDRRALWRIGSWGAAAVGAVTLAVMSNQWSLGLRREQVAAADLARQAQQIQSLAKESQNETRRIASAIETLNNDRDRLFSRVTVIEQGLDSVTGALAKQTALVPTASTAPQASADPQASNVPTGTPQAPQQSAAAAQPPVPAPVTTTAASSGPDKPRADAGKTDASASAAAAANTATATNAGAATTAMISSTAGSSLMAKSTMGPPDPAAPRLVDALKSADATPTDIKGADTKGSDMKMAEAKVDAKADTKGTDAPLSASSGVVASANGADEADTPVASVAVKRTDFAVDLGSANSLGGLRALWRGVRHLNTELGTLSPIVVIREGRTGLGMQLHLAAGPLKDAAAAAKICAMLTETKRACETTVYDGQRLAMKSDEIQSPPTIKAAGPDAGAEAKSSETKSSDAKLNANAEGKADAKPSASSGSSKRGWYRHAKKEEPPPPPARPPEPASTSTLSALFGRK
ncbi:hypothetical protein [Bradyrhizobium sp. Tv2a-2]|uniref:hypothetical protein n=1 Tax=Bradyrhizobium sp. Tv2a-2 TaxID=113395 RepID=UPI00042816F5|nr:hypothetical protein [Bradyrhizobium sp. Tv2a-2]